MLVNILLSVAGFALLIKCADFFVDGAASFAKNFKISTTVIGLTIVAFGTSAPELAISFNSHLMGNADMLFGNVIGSNIANILVIFGLAILIKPFKIHDDVKKKEIPLLLLITVGMSILFLDNFFDTRATNSLSRADGAILILFFTIFVYYLITILKNGRGKHEDAAPPKYKLPMSILMILLGLAGIIIGSHLVVEHVALFAAAIGISQKIISVTIVSIGTSLPELVTTVVAAKKGENNMAIGNIVGSNIFNTCIVLGLPVVLLGEISTTAFNIIDAVFMLAAVFLFWICSAIKRDIRRSDALVFLALYVAYGTYIFLQ